MRSPRNCSQSAGSAFLAVTTAATLFGSTVAASRAGSFQINEQSVSGMGVAYAGGAAVAGDASTLFFNPAGMALLKQAESQTALNYVHPRAEFDNQGSNYGRAFPIRGSDGGGAGRGAEVPNSYYTLPLTVLFASQRPRGSFLNNDTFSGLSVGLGVTAPFGLVTSYDPNFVGRYSATRSKLITSDIQPSLAFTLFNRFSFGGGIDIQYAAARLTQEIDYGLLGFSRGLAPLGFRPGNRDGNTELYGNDWSVGWNIGGIFEYLRKGEHVGFLDDGRIGVSFRSGITHTLDGNVSFSKTPAPFTNVAPFVNQSAKAELKLPETYHFSLYQGFARRFAFLADATLTRWGRLQNIPITYSNPISQASLISDPALGQPGLLLNYKDTWRIAGGFTYQPCDKLLLRVGAAFDESPIQSKATRSPRIPDGDRVFVATGLRYTLPRVPIFYLRNFDIDLDAAYAHLFLPNDPQVNVVDNSFHNVVGKYNAHVDIISASLTFRFGPTEKPADVSKEAKDRSK